MAPSPVMFVYWGRRGLTRFTFELAQAALADTRLAATISVSRQNEDFTKFEALGAALFPVDTFATSAGSVTQMWRIPALRRRLLARLQEDQTQAIIELMPHVWSPFVMPSVRNAGVRYLTLAHDAEVHPGDYRTGWVKGLLDRATAHADMVLTMSEAVTRRLADGRKRPRQKLVTLFHPELGYGSGVVPHGPAPGAPLRLLWLGRIMPYKGLPLFLDAIDILRHRGCSVEVGVFGEGALGDNAARLATMRAEVVNRWLTEAEIATILGRFHAVVLSHTEASQSGIAATALGAGLPAIATPVGGLIEQITDGQTGVLATRVDALALADAISRLHHDPQLYTAISLGISRTRHARSMTQFVADIVSQALDAGPVD